MNPFSLTPLLLVAGGGAVGSVLRYAVSVVAAARIGTGFPWGTLAVNLIGSLAIGILGGMQIGSLPRLLLITGLIGGFTTFSAFSLETVLLFQRNPALAATYVASTMAFGFALCALGWMLGSAIAR